MNLKDSIKSLFGADRQATKPTSQPDGMVQRPVEAWGYGSISNASFGSSVEAYADFNGEKFPGGFGPTLIQFIDYWTLRHRSSQLFNDNLYAKGMIRRLITNEINSGLSLECTPDGQTLGISDDELDQWNTNTENRFELWSSNPQLCDYYGQMTFGEIQKTCRREALINGDVLVVMRVNKRNNLPMVQLISGDMVRTPMSKSPRSGNKIDHGVETNAQGRVVAYWVTQNDGSTRRMPAYGERSGKKIAWLVFGTELRLNEVRGQPLLAVLLQSLKEIDRYRDSVQRKAVINSMMAMFIEKNDDKMGTRPLTNSAVRRDQYEAVSPDGKERKFDIASQIPGMTIEELQKGEKPVAFQSANSDLNFGPFEEAIVQAMAWSQEIPPEIVRLSFSSNYSASQAATNEFKLYLNMKRHEFGQQFNQHVYVEWLYSELLTGKNTADGLLDAWSDPQAYDIKAAWLLNDWAGAIKLAADLFKQSRGYQNLLGMGLITYARAARELTGMKFDRVARTLKKEREMLKAAGIEPTESLASYVTEEDTNPTDGPGTDDN